MLPQVIVSISYKTTKLRRMFTEKAKQPLENMTTPDYGQDIKDNIKERTWGGLCQNNKGSCNWKKLAWQVNFTPMLEQKERKKMRKGTFFFILLFFVVHQ